MQSTDVADAKEDDNTGPQKEEVFESEDFNEPDDANVDAPAAREPQEPNGDVIEEQIKPSQAFQIYAGQLFDPKSGLDKKNGGMASRVYDTTQSKDANFESPLQTYKRLQSEIHEFKQSLDTIAERAQKEQENPIRPITQELSQQIGKLWNNVENFRNDARIKSLFDESNSAMLDTVDAHYLFKRLEEFQAQKLDGQRDSDDHKAGNDKRAVFTLYHDGSTNNQSFRMVDIKERLESLESIIGRKPENPTIGDMTRSIEYLSSVLALLSDEGKLEGLVRRAQVLRKRLQEIQAKGHAAIELQITKTKEEKISTLFEMMSRWDEAAKTLPTVVKRLRSVSNLHEESANIVTKVGKLESQNKVIKSTLEANQEMLNEVKTSLAKNAEVMTTNMSTIQDRLNKIQQQMQSLGV